MEQTLSYSPQKETILKKREDRGGEEEEEEKKTILLISLFQTGSLQNCETMNFSWLSYLLYGTLLQQSQ